MERNMNLKQLSLILLLVVSVYGNVIHDDLEPDVTNTWSLGTATYQFKDAFGDGTLDWDRITDGTFVITGGVVTAGTWNGTAIDISDYTNLTVTSPVTLTDDDIGFDDTALTLSGATANRLLATDASKLLVSVASLESWITGSGNITISDAGSGKAGISGSLLVPYSGADTDININTRNFTMAGNFIASQSGMTWGMGDVTDMTLSGAENASLRPAVDNWLCLGEAGFQWKEIYGVDITASGTVAAATVTGANVTSGADPGHTHTGASLGSIDISDDTNLVAGTNITLADDTLNVDDAFIKNNANDETTGSIKIDTSSTTAFFVEDNGTKDNVFTVDTVNSAVGIGIAPSANAKLLIAGTETTTSSRRGIFSSMTLAPTGNTTTDFIGIDGQLNAGGEAKNYTGLIIGLRGLVSYTDTDATGGNIDDIYALEAKNSAVNINGDFGNVVGLHVSSTGVASNGTWTNHYGILVESIAGATNNFGIKTGTGLNYFGDDIKADGTLKLKEQAAAEADADAYGQVWVKTVTPNELWFTDDAGTDFQIGGTGVASASKEIFIPVMSTRASGTFLPLTSSDHYGSTPALTTTDEAWLSFYVPADFSTITDSVLLIITDFTDADSDFDVETTFAAAGESQGTHGLMIDDSGSNVASGVLFELDVSSALDDSGANVIAAGDYVGVEFTNMDVGGTVVVLGLRLKYQ